MATVTTDADRRSVVELLKDLRDESTALVRQEIALAKTELSEKGAKLGRNSAYLAVGGAVAYAGLMFLLLGLTVLLYAGLVAIGLDHWAAGILAPLIVGAVVAGIGAALVSKAISAFKHETLVPERTVETLKENSRWAQHKITATTA